MFMKPSILLSVYACGLTGGQMYDPADRILEKQLFHPLAVGQIQLHKLKSVQGRQLSEPGFLQPHIIVIVQVVEPDDVITAVDEMPGNVKADKSRRARDKRKRCSCHMAPSMSISITFRRVAS
jgi:hypothetical protein